MDRRHFLTTTAAGGCLLIVGSAYAQVGHINDAINKSGRQRMLSQRMAKSYMQIGQDIDQPRSAKIFTDSISLFERQLNDLQTFSPNAENKATLAELRKAWLRYRDVLVAGKPNTRDGKTVMALSEEVLTLAHASTLQLEIVSGSAAGHLVNISGRQRMLSQRMAKFYQAVSWGVAPTDAVAKLTQSRNEFLAAMKELTASSKNTRMIAAELELAQQQWFFFDQALRSSATTPESKKRFATNVATTSERILETMDRITGMYEQVG